MNGVLDLYCLDCRRFVEWRKVVIYRQDGYTDWRLAVSCGCGNVEDPEIEAIARGDYDERLNVELETMQQNAFDAALTRSGNLYIETLSGTGAGT